MSAAIVVFIVCATACAIAHAAILASTIARPAREQSADVPRPRRTVEFAWALVPILALALVLTATWGRVRDRDSKPVEILKVAR